MNKKVITLLMFLAAFQPILSYGGENSVVAIVEEEPITSFDIEKRANLLMIVNDLPSTPDVMSVIGQQTLYMLIDGKLIEKAALLADIKVKDEEVKMAQKNLALQKNISVQELNKALSSAGVGKNELGKFIHEQAIWAKFLEKEIKPQVHVSDEEVNDNIKAVNRILEQEEGNIKVKIAEIVIYTGQENKNEVKKSLDQLLQKIKNNHDFSKLARGFSQSPSKERGGMIGWLYLEQLSENLKDGVRDLEKGDISHPIMTNDSVIILKVLDKETSGLSKKKDSSQRKQEVYQYLYHKKLNLVIKSFLNKLRKNSFTEIKVLKK